MPRRPVRHSQPKRTASYTRSESSRPATGLRPVRDTGLNVRSARHRARRSGPSPYSLLIALSMLTIVAMLFAVGRSGSRGSTLQQADTASPPTATAASVPERQPTPLFAEYEDLALRLPVDPSAITALAFHQAAGNLALPMKSLVPDADMALAAQLKAVPPLDASATADHDPDVGPADTVWQGCVLRLWRSNRSGAPDTAVDCGANAGSAVWSPVSGTVVLVKAYRLYDKYDDYEIHIRPDGRDDIDVILIHVEDPRVAAGERVKAGVTKIASVRKMSDLVNLQLGGYTDNGGDHVHLQLNALQDGSLSGTGGS